MTQHAELSGERWAHFGLDRQLLMIANEMNRATQLMSPDDERSRRLAYERVLRLADLTVEVNARRSLRRELLRWRDLVAELYISSTADPSAHRSALRALLQLTPTTHAQLQYVLP